MKKSYVGIIITMLLTVFMAAPLWAGQLERINQNGFDAAITVASERCDFDNDQVFDLDMGEFPQPVGMAIVYTPELSANEGDIVEFQLNNATFADDQLFLVIFEGNVDGEGSVLDLDGDGIMELQVIAQYLDFSENSNTVKMRVGVFGWEPNWIMALVSRNFDTNLGSGTTPVPPTNLADYDYNLQIKPLSTNDSVSLQVNWVPGLLPAGISARAVAILDFTKEFEAQFLLPKTCCIEVKRSGRTEFDMNSSCAGTSCVSPTECQASYICMHNAVDLGVEAAINFKVTVSSSTYDGVGAIFIDTKHGGAPTQMAQDATGAYTYTEIYPALSTFPAPALVECDILFNVNGSVIDPRVWQLDLDITTGGCGSVYTATDDDFLEWEFCGNGAQLKTYQTTEGTDPASPIYSFIQLVNETVANPAQVYADVLFSDGTKWDNVRLEDVPCGSNTYRGYEIIAAGLAEDDTRVVPAAAGAKYMVTLTVTTPTNQVHAWAFEVRDGSQRTLSVFRHTSRGPNRHRWF